MAPILVGLEHGQEEWLRHQQGIRAQVGGVRAVSGQTKRQRNTDADRYYDRHKRNPQARAFYRSAAWQRMRRLILERDHGLCQECLRHGRYTPATAVHHKQELLERWDLRLEPSNLEATCDECHNRMRAGPSTAEGLAFDENGDLVPTG